MRTHSNAPHPGPAGTLSFMASGTFLSHCQGEDTRLLAQMAAQSHPPVLTILKPPGKLTSEGHRTL